MVSSTCTASSRVGTSTRPRGRRAADRLRPARETSGSANATVLPLPVRPRPSRSRPARESGRVAAWIGNGVGDAPAASEATSAGATPRLAKVGVPEEWRAQSTRWTWGGACARRAARAGEVTGILIVERDGRRCWAHTREGDAGTASKQTTSPAADAADNMHRVIGAYARLPRPRPRKHQSRRRPPGPPGSPVPDSPTWPATRSDPVGVPSPGHGLPDRGATGPDGAGRGTDGIQSLDFDLADRQLEAIHDGPAESLLAALSTPAHGRAPDSRRGPRSPWPRTDAAASTRRLCWPVGWCWPQRRALWWVLGINAVMFVVELVAGLVAQSTGLVADSLDMLADATHLRDRPAGGWRPAPASGGRPGSVAGCSSPLAGLVLVEVIRRAGTGSEPVDVLGDDRWSGCWPWLANLACVAILARHRGGGAHLRASWIFTTNDALANVGVIVAGRAGRRHRLRPPGPGHRRRDRRARRVRSLADPSDGVSQPSHLVGASGPMELIRPQPSTCPAISTRCGAGGPRTPSMWGSTRREIDRVIR